jgi:predicted membrane chloride channel (bestrophin family)
MIIEQHYSNLLDEFKEQRDAIKQMVTDLEVIKANIHRLIPETLDQRYVRYFEEKVKALTALFNVVLDMRKEITSSLKIEIELRKKIAGEGEDIIEQMEKVLDIRSLSRKIEDFKVESNKLKENRFLQKEQIDKEMIEKTLEAVKK